MGSLPEEVDTTLDIEGPAIDTVQPPATIRRPNPSIRTPKSGLNVLTPAVTTIHQPLHPYRAVRTPNNYVSKLSSPPSPPRDNNFGSSLVGPLDESPQLSYYLQPPPISYWICFFLAPNMQPAGGPTVHSFKLGMEVHGDVSNGQHYDLVVSIRRCSSLALFDAYIDGPTSFLLLLFLLVYIYIYIYT